VVDCSYRFDQDAGEMKYIPRTPEELKQFESIVKSAIGFDEDRNDVIEIVNLQFNSDLESLKPETMVDWLKEQFSGLVQTFIIATVVILVIVLIIRPIAIRAFEFQTEEPEEEVSISDIMKDPVSASIDEGEIEKNMIDIQKATDTRNRNNQNIKNLNDIISKHPKETLAILRKWFDEEV
jgi:flagellar M-ring protein FliF